MRYLFTVVLLVASIAISAQALQSPEQFLGYKIGTKFTRHHRIVEYFDHVAKNASDRVKFETYGKTNEGRSLNLAYISSADNIKNLNEIREANLTRAKILQTNSKTEVGIVWLSYNVHGNEPSSSEAAMLTLYELVTKQANGWLKNTVVIIDPCLNPDGRDRYVNWFNGMVGDYPNVNVASREHDEPWPGGRVNHYYFDLNRDWAWQTQVETQQRIVVYNKWLPHVHVDFHEQGLNKPYYFAPAAEPLHEVITPWQREYQNIIGKNHAKYFDENGWYYFTKERFDLFYPSYGDTYPTYNGSIGMTYEQGGHSQGGLTVQQNNGDTLTLVDRAIHHFTTGMSTVEVASNNNKKMLEQFAAYFANSVNGVGSEYKSYVLTSDNKSKLHGVIKLLSSNDIRYDYVTKVVGQGLNYTNSKLENITLQKHTIVVSAFQPKSLMAKVLLEPKSKLSDSVTYDITAWSLPYAHGIQAYASTLKIDVPANASIESPQQFVLPKTSYAFYVPYTGLNEARLLADLTEANVKVYINEKDITQNGRVFAKGTIMIPKKDNSGRWKTAEDILGKYGFECEIVPVASGFVTKGPDMGSPDNKFIAAPRIACITGEGVGANPSGEIWNFFDREIQYPITMFNAKSIRLSTLKNYNVLIIPDGRNSFLQNKSVADDLKTWVNMGGRIIAIEGGATQMLNGDWGLKLKKEDKEKETPMVYADLKKYENRERDGITEYIPGAIYEVTLDNSHPIAFGYDKTYYTLKQNSDIIAYNKDSWNIGVIKNNKAVSGFAGAKILQQIKDGTVISVQDYGAGAIIYFTDDPIFRNFWQNGKLLLFNAAFLVGNNAVRL